ncbi:MAG: hypothetical protein A2Y62_09345 [Candidatus Fischerbacteria bacterium RBG_13_37_8]|uniref:Restriction endonuclease n=1 Tax=Candidatus Fischerbacteria bacterium RBG_13_37_8 TaxID=1817863 RepID=A0A1F5VKK7_9BACT|nr:MAG: hypothetical protein A2Y62_09345 [Candidatus Fischerbacteria bacterium RBG_13_37_8]
MIKTVSELITIEIPEWKSLTINNITLTRDDEELVEQIAEKVSVDNLKEGVRINAKSWVGVIRFSQFEVHIIPKLAGGYCGLVKMIEFACGLQLLRWLSKDRMIKIEKSNDLYDLVALLLVEECEKLLSAGLLSDYIEIESDIPVLRGRFLTSKQITKRFGEIDRLECRYDEYLKDIPENQIIEAALSFCARRIKNEELLMRCRYLYSVFSEACSTNEIVMLQKIRENLTYNRLNEYYRTAHILAWHILDGLGINDIYVTHDRRCFAFLFDMNKLFEEFIYKYLQKTLEKTNFIIRDQFSIKSIIYQSDSDHRYKNIRPDFIIQAKNNIGTKLPIDAKYVLIENNNVPRDICYQIFIYAYALGRKDTSVIPSAAFIFPSASEETNPISLSINVNGKKEACIKGFGLHILTAIREVEENRFGLNSASKQIMEFIWRNLVM